MPATKLTDADFTDGVIDIMGILVRTGIAKSRGDARRLIEKDKCVSVDDVKINDISINYTQEALRAQPIILRKGKKIYHKVEA